MMTIFFIIRCRKKLLWKEKFAHEDLCWVFASNSVLNGFVVEEKILKSSSSKAVGWI